MIVNVSAWVFAVGGYAAPVDHPAAPASAEAKNKPAKPVAGAEKIDEERAAIDRELEAMPPAKARKAGAKPLLLEKAKPLNEPAMASGHFKLTIVKPFNAQELEKAKPAVLAAKQAGEPKIASHLSEPDERPKLVAIGGPSVETHRLGQNPAVIGGLAQVRARNAGVINGSTLKRIP
jgi:hypothetical protein